MQFALENRQAIEVRVQAFVENDIAVVQQVVRGHRCCNVGALRHDKVNGLLGSNVLHHDFEFGHRGNKWHQVTLDEHAFTIKEVDVWIGDLAQV